MDEQILKWWCSLEQIERSRIIEMAYYDQEIGKVNKEIIHLPKKPGR